MSLSTKTSTMAADNSTDSIVASTEEKEIGELLPQMIKRSLSIEIPMEAKKMMVHHDTATKMSQCAAPSCSPLKCASGAAVTASTNTNSDAIPEISDEELLQMALMLEKGQHQ